MNDYLNITERAKKGPILQKTDWDLQHVILPVRDLVAKYQIVWDKMSCTASDKDMIDRIFLAARELAIRSGVFCLDTQRVIHFSADEIDAGMRSAPQSLLMGEGNDSRLLLAVKPGDQGMPLIWAGNPGAPMSDEEFLPIVMSWMQEPLVDLVTCGSIVSVEGCLVEKGAPTEIIAVRRELEYMHTGLKKVGRSGMGMLAGQSAVSSLGDATAMSSGQLRHGDAHLVAMLNELMIDIDNMNRAVSSINTGVRNASLATVMVGGLAGDAPGAAIVQAASFMLANLICRADYHILHPIHIRHISTSTRSVMWVQSAVLQAFARNAPCIIVADIYPKSGAGTRELLLEVAANAITITVSGGHLEGAGSADGILPNCSGLEARWMAEVALAVIKQQPCRAEAEALIQHLLSQYEQIFTSRKSNPGSPFSNVYDPATLQPRKFWKELYLRARDELHKLGLHHLR